MQTIDDALQFIPGVTIDRNRGLTTTGTHTAVTMRGTGSANRTLILKDGIPINDAYTGGVSEWNSMATGSIARIEVVRGPGSAIHGSNSMGGTINLVTASPTEKPTLGVDLRYGSMNTLQAGVKAGKAFKSGFGIMVSGEYKKTDGYRYMADSLWRDYFKTPSMELFNVNTKLVYQIDPASKLEAVVDHHLQMPLSGTSTIYDDKTTITNSLLRYIAGKGAVNIEATGYINTQLRVSDANQWNNVDKAYSKDNYDSRTPVDIYGFIGKVSRSFGSHLITTGADLRYTSASTRRFNYGSGYQNFSGGQNFLSFFINDDLKIGSKVNVNVGVRYDNWQNLNGRLFDSTSGEEIHLEYDKASASVWSPKVGVVYQASQKLRFRTQFAQGFRAPAIYDLYISGPLGSSFFRLGNPDLKPERMVYSVELGSDLYLGNIELTLTGYLSQYRDFAERVEVDASKLPSYLDPGGLPVRQFTNIGQVNLGGIESSLRYLLTKHFTLIGSYFYNHSRIAKYETNPDYVGNEMNGNPRHTVSGGLVFDLPAKLYAAIWVRSTSKSFGNLENSANRVMAPVTTADLKVSYQLKRFTLNANALNLLDKLYFGSYTSPTSYQYAPRRSVNLGISFSL
ncbi:ligand-gated channel protein [Ravibacter arvi]|uniref:Ligand-gated channel protein n=2 Tax=Ravibacter arvi TaxID=2051041 RepID=A0ABP8LXA4_9BACT